MRRLALVAGLVLALDFAAPVVAGGSPRCSIAVTPAGGTTTDGYRITGRNFPASTFERLTDVHLAVGRARDGRLMPTMFLTLFPGRGGNFFVDFHASVAGQVAPPLQPGLYRVRAEANGHECIAVTSFWVRR